MQKGGLRRYCQAVDGYRFGLFSKHAAYAGALGHTQLAGLELNFGTFPRQVIEPGLAFSDIVAARNAPDFASRCVKDVS